MSLSKSSSRFPFEQAQTRTGTSETATRARKFLFARDRAFILLLQMSHAPLNFPCSNCGAHLVVDGSTQTPMCSYCHTETLLPEELWTRFHPRPAPVFSSPGTRAPQKKNSVGIIIGALVAVAIIGGIIAIAVSLSSNKPPPIGRAGDACGGRTNACSLDKKAYLTCDANDKLAVVDTCKGPNGCRVSANGGTIQCDATFADVKDPCEGTDDACSTDHKAELTCVAGKYKVRATCKGADGCTQSPAGGGMTTISCDDHLADVGDPCFDTERTACSTDHKSLLTCTAQKFAVEHACKGPKGCTITKNLGSKTVDIDCEGPR